MQNMLHTENIINAKTKQGGASVRALLLPVLYLLGFIVSSDAVRFKFGVDLSFWFVVMLIAYYFLFYKKSIKDTKFYVWWIYLFVVPTLLMTLLKEGDMDHMIYCVLILLLPIALEPFIPEDDKTIKAGLYFVVVVSLMLLFLYANFGFLSNWNKNSMGYLLFLGFSALTILLSCNRKSAWLWFFYAYAFVQLLVTESRNISMAIITTMLLVILKNTVSKKTVFRVVYIVALLYPAVFPLIAMELVGTPLYDFLAEITKDLYDKGQGGVFSGRIPIFEGAVVLIKKSPFHSLFGYGKTMVSFYAAHNGYYVLHYTFGLIGTLLIAGMLIFFFEKTRALVESGDSIAYGCFAIMISVLTQQASEGWFLASYLLVLMPFVYMAIIIKRYRSVKRGLLKK